MEAESEDQKENNHIPFNVNIPIGQGLVENIQL